MVATAEENAPAGRNANPMIFSAVPTAAEATSPRELMIAVIIRKEMWTRES